METGISFCNTFFCSTSDSRYGVYPAEVVLPLHPCGIVCGLSRDMYRYTLSIPIFGGVDDGFLLSDGSNPLLWVSITRRRRRYRCLGYRKVGSKVLGDLHAGSEGRLPRAWCWSQALAHWDCMYLYGFAEG